MNYKQKLILSLHIFNLIFIVIGSVLTYIKVNESFLIFYLWGLIAFLTLLYVTTWKPKTFE